MTRIASLVVVCCIVCKIRSRNFSRCELKRELEIQGFPLKELRDWVCLVEAESSRRTDVVGGPDGDGSFDYGLFQINDRYWCSTGSGPGKDCNVRCNDLLTDNITKASHCTKIIFKQQGFEAWVGWVNECRSKILPDLSNCSFTSAN